MHQVNEIIQIITATLLGLVSILLAKHSRSGQNTWTGITFTVGIVCYIIIESQAVQSMTVLRIVTTIGAICIPVLFWFLARAIFEDHFKFTPVILSWFAVQLLPHFNFFLPDLTSWQGFAPLSNIVAGAVSFGFVLAGLHTASKTKKSDLVDSRIRFRNTFMVVTATVIGMTLIVEAIPIERQTILGLQILQRASIFGITLYFLISNFEIRSGFFFREIPKAKVERIDDPVLSEKLQKLMEEQKIYRKEGLTIRELAILMNEQEYRLRRLINGQLGFRNFNDFLNQYRINDACETLSDPSQSRKTILEIAYDLGYQSIGPFNKAFKDLKGLTPTAYRKSQVNN